MNTRTAPKDVDYMPEFGAIALTLPVSQFIADWKQQNATDAVQKIARFAVMFGSVTHLHQPHVT